jgi:hypothetical protein
VQLKPHPSMVLRSLKDGGIPSPLHWARVEIGARAGLLGLHGGSTDKCVRRQVVVRHERGRSRLHYCVFRCEKRDQRVLLISF